MRPVYAVLYDGWPLVYRPNSPASLHLLALLKHLPAEVEPILALPTGPPEWLPQVATHVQPTPDTPAGRLKWEQVILPGLAPKLEAQLIHLTSSTSSLFGPSISVISPCEFGIFSPRGRGKEPPGDHQKKTFWERLREALAQGGLARGRALFWPNDLPKPRLPIAVICLPPVVHPDFHPDEAYTRRSQPGGIANLDLPETYVLYHGPGSAGALQRLLASWSWAAGSIGEYYPLLLMGLDRAAKNQLVGMVLKYNLEATVRALPAIPPEVIPDLYLGCSALLHPIATSPWGGPLRHALACGKPIVALEDTWADAIAGPAAFLVPGNDPRDTGAAVITVIVEEEVAENLSQAARQRASAWNDRSFSEELSTAYRGLILSD